MIDIIFHNPLLIFWFIFLPLLLLVISVWFFEFFGNGRIHRLIPPFGAHWCQLVSRSTWAMTLIILMIGGFTVFRSLTREESSLRTALREFEMYAKSQTATHFTTGMVSENELRQIRFGQDSWTFGVLGGSFYEYDSQMFLAPSFWSRAEVALAMRQGDFILVSGTNPVKTWSVVTVPERAIQSLDDVYRILFISAMLVSLPLIWLALIIYLTAKLLSYSARRTEYRFAHRLANSYELGTPLKKVILTGKVRFLSRLSSRAIPFWAQDMSNTSKRYLVWVNPRHNPDLRHGLVLDLTNGKRDWIGACLLIATILAASIIPAAIFFCLFLAPRHIYKMIFLPESMYPLK